MHGAAEVAHVANTAEKTEVVLLPPLCARHCLPCHVARCSIPGCRCTHTVGPLSPGTISPDQDLCTAGQ